MLCHFALLSFIFAAPAFAEPAPAGVVLRSVAYAGTGCPSRTVDANLTRTGTLELAFDQFIAEFGPGIPISVSRRSCSFALDLVVPSGWSYAVTGFETRGSYVAFEAGIVSKLEAYVYFQGAPVAERAHFVSNLTGPLNRDLIETAKADTALVWSPCLRQRALNLATKVQLNGERPFPTNRRGLYTIEEGPYTQRYSLSWRRCV